MSVHELHRDDAGAYLLGALTDLEREAFERHLEECAECREQVERLRPAAEALPRSVEPLAPPPGLKVALMEAVREEAAEDERAPGRPRPTLRRRLARLAGGAPRLQPALAWASACLLLALGVAGGYGLAKAMSANEARTIAATVDRSRIPRASATLSVPGNGKQGAILRVIGLPSLSRGVYQAWVQRGRAIVPEPTFEVGRNGVGAAAVPGDLSDAKAVLVTREPRGGSRAPSEAPLLRVRL